MVAGTARMVKGSPEFLVVRGIVAEFGALTGSSDPRDGPVMLIGDMDTAFVAMSHTPCLDRRADWWRNIIEPDLLPDEIEAGGVQRMFRPARCFTVHDTLAFNCINRELQSTSVPHSRMKRPVRGTKGMTLVLGAVGLGPPKEAKAWNVVNGDHRGPASTDPNKVESISPGSKWRLNPKP